MDRSTLNVAAIRKLPLFKLAAYHLGCGRGNACAGDPPGFPTYFTRSVYTPNGNPPPRGPDMVIEDGDHLRAIPDYPNRNDAFFKKLWLPLPLTHQRTRLWIEDKYRHHNHCYHQPEHQQVDNKWSETMMIWPGGCLGKTPFGNMHDIEFDVKWAKEHESFAKWRQEEQDKFVADRKADNERITRLCQEVAVPSNHDAVILIRQFYPEYQPEPDLITHPPERMVQWWETEAKAPANTDECNAQLKEKYGDSATWRHPINGTCCQWCGWQEGK